MKRGALRILLAGDVMLGRLVNEVLQRRPAASVWGDTLPLFREAHWPLCNLECVLADGGSPWTETPKVFHFRSDARNVAVLQAASMDAVSLANNHSLDYGYDALFECLQVLDRANIRRAGAGRNFAEASAPVRAEVHGVRTGFIAFTDNQPEWEAGPKQAGVFFVPIHLRDRRAAHLLDVVRQTRREVEVLVVSAHWGGNWGRTPPAAHVAFGRALIEAGADVVFGHSAHVFRGVEVYRGRPILYSTGDFIDDYAVDPLERNDQSFLFHLELEGGRLERLKLYPTLIRDFRAERAGPREAAEIARRMTRLCEDLGTRPNWNPEEGCLEILP